MRSGAGVNSGHLCCQQEWPLAPPMSDPRDHVLGAILGGTVVAAMLQYIPFVAAFIGLIFYSLQIWESKTVQTRVAHWRTRAKERQLIKMRNAIKKQEENLAGLQKRLRGLTES
jgi:hypothetical protein